MAPICSVTGPIDAEAVAAEAAVVVLAAAVVATAAGVVLATATADSTSLRGFRSS